jgi:hypothetical protein
VNAKKHVYTVCDDGAMHAAIEAALAAQSSEEQEHE